MSQYQKLRWFNKDFTSLQHLNSFYKLIGKQLSIPLPLTERQNLHINEHFLFFNPMDRELSSDGYFMDQTPRYLIKDQIDKDYKRRLWVSGSIIQKNPLRLNNEYDCLERVIKVKNYRNDSFVSLQRDIVDMERQVKILTEIRTLVFTNSKPKANNVKIIKDTSNDKIIGNFTFNEMDIVRYSQLSLNPHRIHWDKTYTKDHEGYLDILAQGPFTAQILTLFAEDHIGHYIQKMNYRNLNYIYPGTTVDICVRFNQLEDKYQFYMRDSKQIHKIYLFLQVESFE